MQLITLGNRPGISQLQWLKVLGSVELVKESSAQLSLTTARK